MADGMTSSEAARKQFEEDNNIQIVPTVDSIFKYSHAEQQQILNKKPWDKQ